PPGVSRAEGEAFSCPSPQGPTDARGPPAPLARNDSNPSTGRERPIKAGLARLEHGSQHLQIPREWAVCGSQPHTHQDVQVVSRHATVTPPPTEGRNALEVVAGAKGCVVVAALNGRPANRGALLPSKRLERFGGGGLSGHGTYRA